MREHILHIDGHQLVAHEYNEGVSSTPMIFLHGINASTCFWETDHKPILEDKVNWYSLSLPGHYPAAFPAEVNPQQINAQNLTQIIVKAIRQLVDNRPVILVGHSTGGFFALSVASTAPEMVESVLCVAGFTRGKWHGLLGMYQKMVTFGVAGAEMYKFLYRGVKIFKFYLGLVFRIFYTHSIMSLSKNRDYPALLAQTHTAFRSLDLSAMVVYFRQMPHENIRPQLTNISAPVTVIYGSKDPLVPTEESKYVATELRGTQKYEIPDVGHLPMWEAPAVYQAHFKEWLASVELGRENKMTEPVLG